MTNTERNAIEQAYIKLLEYEQSVQDFLLYVCGFHNCNDSEWLKSAELKMEALANQKKYSFEIAQLISKNQLQSTEELTRITFLHQEFITISRNTREWINSAKLLLNIYKTS